MTTCIKLTREEVSLILKSFIEVKFKVTVISTDYECDNRLLYHANLTAKLEDEGKTPEEVATTMIETRRIEV